MEILNNQLYVQQGEAFTLDFFLRNKDGSPYIVSRQLKNPYYLVTVSSMSTNSNKDKRYLLNKWCKITADRFYVTTPVHITGVSSFNFTAMKSKANADGCTVANYAVYYTTDSNGNVTYYKYTGTDDAAYNSAKMVPYENNFVVSFSTDVTIDWTEHMYMYGIQLVDGDNNPDFVSGTESRPLLNAESVQSILPPTQMIVTNNINGSLSGGINL